MKQFTYARAGSLLEATNQADAQSRFIAGGTNLLDLMKLEIEQPTRLIDIANLPLRYIEFMPNGVKIGALVSNSELAADPVIRQDYPVLARALLSGASGQLRNMATTGGNLLQRTRCYYFYQPDSPCNKRNPGSGCPARQGQHRNLAILGVSEDCIANHPSDMAVAMRVLDASIETQQTDGTWRQIPIADFYRLPGNTPHIETVLQPGELITAIHIPKPVGGVQSYDKVRDRASYAFALVSLAAVIQVQNGQIENIQFAFGGVGTQPWRNHEAEALLQGTHGEHEHIEAAMQLILQEAVLDEQTAFKPLLMRRLLKHAIERALRLNAPSSPVSCGVLS